MERRKDHEREKLSLAGAPVRSTIARLLEMPESTLSVAGVHIELNSNREAVIEGCTGVLSYSDEAIRLTVSGMVLKFTGRNLSIGGMDRSSAVVSGYITALEFLS